MHIDLINIGRLSTVAELTDERGQEVSLLTSSSYEPSDAQKPLAWMNEGEWMYIVVEDRARQVFSVEDVERNCFELEVPMQDIQKLLSEAGLENKVEY